ncbi:MAG: hydroxymethylbilane synthase [Thermoplasmata archaeon]
MKAYEKIRIGTRGSKLALYQANLVAQKIEKLGIKTEIIKITSSGDNTTTPLRMSKEYGLFTKEINENLLNDNIDIAVHSMKDLPTEMEPELEISAVLERGPIEDFFYSQYTLNTLPKGSKVGTSSERRRNFLKFFRNDIEVVDIRGNIDTRIKKLKNGQMDGIVLAYAGISRLGLNITGEMLNPDIFVPQANQGAIAVVSRKKSFDYISKNINDEKSLMVTSIERDALKTINAGCHSSVGILARLVGEKILFHSAVIKGNERNDFWQLFDLKEKKEFLKRFERWYHE